ncbi:MAG: iron-containing alcohol dehydrogenase [Puniceicoccales bacterium]|jgi:alcohol dehydrogenase YqhD (iron-dependent ADH family)|nr:iron-containing alcohol dehydrogenase [Puniceicoccales bacterium]
MRDFNFCNPVRVHFGQNAIRHLPAELADYGPNVLLIYGGGSIKKNGIYDAVIKIMGEQKKNVFELSGVMANPRTEKVYEGIEMVRENNIDFMLAVGGGSVIDCTKAISAGSRTDKDFWETFFIGRGECQDALPFGTILTIAATGSEMNSGGVITNWEKKIKTSYGHRRLFPKFSILDPIYTYTLPKNQMIYGAVDILSHIMEAYFSYPDDGNVSDDIAEALTKNVIANLNVALKEPTNYHARANLMWASSLALNGIINIGKEQDWMTHQIEHALSAFYDIPHGAGLAVVHPNYLKYVYGNAPKKFVRYAANVWQIPTAGKTEEKIALEGIGRLQQYFREIGAPTTLAEVNIPAEAIGEIAAGTNLLPGSYHPMTREDVKNVLLLCK